MGTRVLNFADDFFTMWNIKKKLNVNKAVTTLIWNFKKTQIGWKGYIIIKFEQYNSENLNSDNSNTTIQLPTTQTRTIQIPTTQIPTTQIPKIHFSTTEILDNPNFILSNFKT